MQHFSEYYCVHKKTPREVIFLLDFYFYFFLKGLKILKITEYPIRTKDKASVLALLQMNGSTAQKTHTPSAGTIPQSSCRKGVPYRFLPNEHGDKRFDSGTRSQ